jgi:hypothetical protein
MNNTATGDYRRRIAFAAAAAGLLFVVSACAAATPHHAVTPHHAAAGVRHQPTTAPRVVVASRTRVSSPATASAVPPGTEPHFRTPRAAMTYLAAAYNRHDDDALHEVTTPTAFRALRELRRSEAIDLAFRSCRATGRGDYACTFTHRYPNAPGHGEMIVITAPALNPGWYMYRVVGCG